MTSFKKKFIQVIIFNNNSYYRFFLILKTLKEIKEQLILHLVKIVNLITSKIQRNHYHIFQIMKMKIQKKKIKKFLKYINQEKL